MDHVTARSASLFLPFKGRTEVDHVTARSASLFLPFKGRTEVGMGFYSRAIEPIPIPPFPLKGKVRIALRGDSYPSPSHPSP